MFRRATPYPGLDVPKPVKDGRYQPSYLYSRQRRRTVIRRLLLLGFVVAVIYAVVVSGALRGRTRKSLQDIAKREQVILSTAQPVDSVPEVVLPTVEEVQETDTEVVKPAETEIEEIRLQIEGKHNEKTAAAPEPPVSSAAAEAEPTSSRVPEATEDDNFEDALTRILSLLPDEMHIRELLRPVEGTGKEKLREIGLRARAYKIFFEAWEALHLVSMNGQSYIRHDIVQLLRRRYGSAEFDDSNFVAQTVRSYEAYRYFLQRLSSLLFPWTAPYFPDHLTLHTHFLKGGRGLVLTAGDDQATYLLTSIPSFRRLGCTLPIEIMYLGDSDLSEDYRAELEALPGVITRDLSQMIEDTGWTLKGWAAKPFAMLMSSFREVIFVDADALFFENPEILFEDPAYIETGTVFFKDRLMMPESKRRWLQQILAKPISKKVRQSRMWTGESAHMQESGVVVVDKWKHFVALLMVTRMNGPDRDGNAEEGRIGVYDMVYGKRSRTLPFVCATF